jgi:hypothetical protein
MRFKDLSVGEHFEFDRRDKDGFEFSGLATGPWTKTSQRCYIRDDDGMRCQVGSINVKVRTDINDA